MSEIVIPEQASSGGLTEIQRGVTSSLRFPAYGEDPAIFATAPKVTVTRDSDGSDVLSEVEATMVPAADEDIQHWVVDVKGTDIREVDRLKVVWSDGASTYTTSTEVVGGFVTSLRGIERKLGKKPTVTEEDAASAREVALRSIEDVCGIAFRTRYTRETLDGSGARQLLVPQANLQSVFSVSVDGEAIDITGLTVDSTGIVIASNAWPEGNANVEIAYIYGFESFPQAALPVRDLAAHLLTPAPTDWDERATAVSDANMTYSIVVAGVRGAAFPLPSVNAFVEQHRYVTVV